MNIILGFEKEGKKMSRNEKRVKTTQANKGWLTQLTGGLPAW
jgi:hypothetical protein